MALLVLNKPSAQTINIGLYHLSNGIPEDVFIAALAVACVPTIVFFLIFQRNIMAGLTAGGVKGEQDGTAAGRGSYTGGAKSP